MNRLFFILLSLLFLSFSLQASVLANIRFASKPEIRAFLGTDTARLVFENKGYLYYVDLSAGSPQALRLNATAGGILPNISPDGQWVTYNTGVTADYISNAGRAKAWVLPLSGDTNAIAAVVDSPAYEPRINAYGSDMYVVYANKGGQGTYDSAGCSMLRKKVSAGPTLGAVETVFSGGGYAGGLSRDHRYLSSGQPDARIFDLQNPSTPAARIHRLTYRLTSGRDTVMSTQTCNTSTSASDLFTDAMMYVDFGRSATGYSHLVLNKWAFHTLIFVSTADNSLWKAVRIPTYTTAVCCSLVNKWEWDDPEWSTHPYFATASLLTRRCYSSCAAEERNVREKICLVDLRPDSSWIPAKASSYMMPLIICTDSSSATGVDLKWSHLWVKKPAGFSETPNWLKAGVPIAAELRLFPTRSGMPSVTLDASGVVLSSSPLNRVELYDVSGRLVLQADGGQRTKLALNAGVIGRLSAGIYTVRAETRDGRAVKSWVKVK